MTGEWQSIETAPKGGGADDVRDPRWVEPPPILLLCAGKNQIVASWDWYYAEGGNGYEPGHLAWVEPMSGEPVHRDYGPPTHWMPLPPAPRD